MNNMAHTPNNKCSPTSQSQSQTHRSIQGSSGSTHLHPGPHRPIAASAPFQSHIPKLNFKYNYDYSSHGSGAAQSQSHPHRGHGHGHTAEHAHVPPSQAEKLQAIHAIETRMRAFFSQHASSSSSSSISTNTSRTSTNPHPSSSSQAQARLLALTLSQSHPLTQNIDTAFTVYGDRLQADIRDFKALCGALVRQEQMEKEQWRVLCGRTLRERDWARAALDAGARRSGGGRMGGEEEGNSPTAGFTLKREREETSPTFLAPPSATEDSQTRPICPLPRSRSLPSLPSFDDNQWVSNNTPSPTIDVHTPCTPARSNSTPPQPTTSNAYHLPSPPPLRPKLNVNVDVNVKTEEEEERELKRRRSCDSSSSSTTLVNSTTRVVHSPSSASGSGSGSEAESSRTARRPETQGRTHQRRAGHTKQRSTDRVITLPDDFMHVDIMYIPVGDTLVCRACQIDIAKAPLSPRHTRPSPKSFPASAPWDDLREHCVRVHPEACVDVGRLHPAELYELRRRLGGM